MLKPLQKSGKHPEFLAYASKTEALIWEQLCRAKRYSLNKLLDKANTGLGNLASDGPSSFDKEQKEALKNTLDATKEFIKAEINLEKLWKRANALTRDLDGKERSEGKVCKYLFL